ncbi:MAG: EamA family transporter, partial [Planctomycetes bacterium]|nr:EamA family transporter [Planctomycetota bacterium]
MCVATAAILWASTATAGKALFASGLAPMEIAQTRLTLSALIIGIGSWIVSKDLLKVRLRDLWYFLLLGGVCLALVQGAYFYAISKIHVAAAILLQNTASVFVAIFSFCFFKERLTTPKMAALILALGGCYLVVGGYDMKLLQMNRLGIFAGLIGAISFAGYTLMGERGMHRYRPWTVLFYTKLFAAITWHFLYTPFSYATADITGSQWVWLIYICLAGTIFPCWLYFVGINYIRSTQASIMASLEPISAAVMA